MIIGYYGFSTKGLDSFKLAILFGFLIGAGYGLITGPITIIAASDFKGNLLNSSQSVAGVLRQVGAVLAVAIFVTCLYGNLGQAQNKSMNYANNTISKINLPGFMKDKIINDTDKAIKNRNSNDTKKVNTGISVIDNQLTLSLRNIKSETKKNYIFAFKKLYKDALPFMLLSILSITLFDKKRKD